jgi:hypothetical protein
MMGMTMEEVGCLLACLFRSAYCGCSKHYTTDCFCFGFGFGLGFYLDGWLACMERGMK